MTDKLTCRAEQKLFDSDIKQQRRQRQYEGGDATFSLSYRRASWSQRQKHGAEREGGGMPSGGVGEGVAGRVHRSAGRRCSRRSESPCKNWGLWRTRSQ